MTQTERRRVNTLQRCWTESEKKVYGPAPAELNFYLHMWIPEAKSVAGQQRRTGFIHGASVDVGSSTSTVWDCRITKAKSSTIGLEPKFKVILLYVPVGPLMSSRHWRLRLDCVIAVTPVHILISSHFKLCVLHFEYCAIGKSMTSVRFNDSCAAFSLQCCLLTKWQIENFFCLT